MNMRNLTPEEKKKLEFDLYARMMKSISTTYSTQANSNFKNGWTNSMIGGVSPTDVDAKSMYEYQEPEQDEQGTMYGYKVLNWDEQYLSFVSPRYTAHWTTDGQLHSDCEPGERIMNGIHFTKRPDHPELGNYSGYPWTKTSFLVKCALSQTVVETSQGFRAQHAQILGVFIENRWISYQEYVERMGYGKRNYTYEWQDR